MVSCKDSQCHNKRTSRINEIILKKWQGAMDKYEAFHLTLKQIKSKHPEPYYRAGFVKVD